MEDFSSEQIEKMKDEFTKRLLETGREGMPCLISWLEENHFFEAPCSTQYHLSCRGGLVRHSLNVCDTILKTATAICTRDNIPDVHSLVIVALLHDIGKCGDREKPMYVDNVLKSGKRSEGKPYTSNPDLLYIPHEVRSIAIIERFIDLTEVEEHAILYHNGLYSSLGYEWKGKEQPLDLLLHWADMWNCRIVEVEKNGNMETDS